MVSSPRSSRDSPSSDVLVVSDSRNSRPSTSKSVLSVELDVGDLSLSGPGLVGKDPLNESSVFSISVLNDEL